MKFMYDDLENILHRKDCTKYFVSNTIGMICMLMPKPIAKVVSLMQLTKKLDTNQSCYYSQFL